MILPLSYLHKGISNTDKIASLYWIRTQKLSGVATHIKLIHSSFAEDINYAPAMNMDLWPSRFGLA